LPAVPTCRANAGNSDASRRGRQARRSQRQLTALGTPAADGAAVVQLIKAGDARAIHAMRQSGRDIGEVLAMSISLINPALIAIGGPVSAVGEHLLAGVRETVYARSMPLATKQLHIVQARAGADAGLTGAAMLAIHCALGPRPKTS
jgi:predicted NBD/HSP70 family sugar kinase